MVNVKFTFDEPSRILHTPNLQDQRVLISTNTQNILISHINYFNKYMYSSLIHFLKQT